MTIGRHAIVRLPLLMLCGYAAAFQSPSALWSNPSVSATKAGLSRSQPRHFVLQQQQQKQTSHSVSRRRQRLHVTQSSSLFSTTALVQDAISFKNDTAAVISTETTPPPESSSLTSYPPTPTFRECLAFALPAVGIYLCSPLMSLIDTSFVGRLSTSTELAALGPAASISDSASMPLLFLSLGATNLIAKSHAQNDTATTARVSRTTIGMGTVCGLVFAALLYTLSQPISVLYCGGPTAPTANLLAPACTQYVAIRALALPAVVVTTIAQAICIGTKDTKNPMISVGLAGVCNLLGDFILVKGLKQGIVGAAWATSLSQVLAAGLLLRVLKKRGFLRSQRHIISDDAESSSTTKKGSNPGTTTTSTLATIKQLLSFIPFLFIMSVKIFWHSACSATAASLGEVPAAAHTALMSVGMVCMMLGDVGSSLSQAFLPPFEGTATTEDPATTANGTPIKKSSSKSTFNLEAAMPTIRQLFKVVFSMTATVTTFAAIVIGIFGGQITSDPAVLLEMRETLPWILAALSFHGTAVALEGLLLSKKMFQPLSFCYVILALSVAAFQVATRRFGLGLAGVW
eukprot:CAMPEP_0194034308 /NCGR_PEP_ID=MMETSP0009_2-20130614/6710_1 /TAXON_ID=210454 /ORGANISM="Grammatophora oceanica, Strain CCMP 410" /LENGTH=572 /DNA_ID=CAMNT_0038675163 /DNA_START=86 /DNA_END=1801 /DNA_ORIENTATION=-